MITKEKTFGDFMIIGNEYLFINGFFKMALEACFNASNRPL